MVYKHKGQFKLDIRSLRKIVGDILRQPRNKDIKIDLKKSDNANSKSLYLFFYLGDVTTCLRISDHDCKGKVRQLLVSESTGIANVYYKIDKVIKELRFKQLYKTIGR